MIVYRHIRLDTNEVFYIGIGKSISRAYSKKSRNRYWKHIVNTTLYRVDILFEDLTWKDACDKETEFIYLYGRKDLGLGTLVNMTDGGDGTINHSPEVIESIRKKLTGRKKPVEIAKKSAISRTGLKRQPETGIKISAKLRGKPKSAEHKANIGKVKKGNKNRAIPVLQYSKEGVFIEEHNSQYEASQKTNTGHRSINNNIKGLSKTAGGFIWKLK